MRNDRISNLTSSAYIKHPLSKISSGKGSEPFRDVTLALEQGGSVNNNGPLIVDERTLEILDELEGCL